MSLPKDAKERKQMPVTTGVLDYFPDAIAEVAHVSFVGNAQHNGAGTPLHWAREKSTDHADCIVRHLLERGTFDSDGMRHSAKLAWRSLALLQIEIERHRAELTDATDAFDQRFAHDPLHVTATGSYITANGVVIGPPFRDKVRDEARVRDEGNGI